MGDALILQTSTQAGQIEGDAPSVRVAYVDDDDADFVAEGSEIPESEPDLAEAVIFTGRINQLIRITEEQYLQPSTPQQLAQSVARAIVRRADLAYLRQAAPTPPANGPSTGLLNLAGTVNGGAVSTDLDALVDLVATLQGNLATPTHIVVGPKGWAELRKLKQSTTNNNVSLIGAGTDDAQQRLLSLPVVVTNAITDLAGLVLDQRAIVSATGSVKVDTSRDAYFTSQSVALRASWRIGHTVPRPGRVGKFTVAAPGS